MTEPDTGTDDPNPENSALNPENSAEAAEIVRNDPALKAASRDSTEDAATDEDARDTP